MNSWLGKHVTLWNLSYLCVLMLHNSQKFENLCANPLTLLPRRSEVCVLPAYIKACLGLHQPSEHGESDAVWLLKCAYKRPYIFCLVHLGCSLWRQLPWKKSDYSETTVLKRPHAGSLVNSSSWALSQQANINSSHKNELSWMFSLQMTTTPANICLHLHEKLQARASQLRPFQIYDPQNHE